MLKGKTVIELTDVKTGQVERYEDENIVTNALQEYMEALFLIGSISRQFPMYKNALGGIRLYETALEESVTNVLMPSLGQSKCVGYASYNTKTNADARRGNLNQQETTVLDNGVQLVWDFATSEANGTIACVCLTPKENGEDLCVPTAGDAYNLGSSYMPYRYVFGIDEGNGWLYCHDGTKALKCKFPAGSIGLRREGLFQPLEVVEVLGEWNFNERYNVYRLLDANTVYYISSYNSETLKEYRINLQTGEQTTVDYAVPNAQFKSSITSYRFNGYTIFPQSSTLKMVKVNLANVNDVTLMDVPKLLVSWEKSNGSRIFKLQNGDALYGNVIIDVVSGSYGVMFTEPNYSGHSSASPYVAKYKGCKILGCKPDKSNSSFGNGYIYMAADIERLMTINNLQTPVTKTADKTMKITYTLLESESV